MWRAIIVSGVLLFPSGVLFAQNVESNLAFEVASVKPSTVPLGGSPGTDGGPGTRFPERYAAFTTLSGYLFRAYGLEDPQQVSGPAWIDADKYAIQARVPPGTSKEQFQRMLQNLLVERFHLAIHHETIVLPVYNLVLARGGPKFKESPDTPDAASVPPGNDIDNAIDRDGFPFVPPGQPVLLSRFTTGPSGPVSHWKIQRQPIAAFARMLGLPPNAGRTVVDKTGLTGKYDFTLYYDVQLPGVPAATDSPILTIFDAVEQQLGLRLVDGKAPFDKIVVDRAERVPVEN